MMHEEPTRVLAQFAAGLVYERIPQQVVEHIKLCLLDTLGCGLFGSTLSWTRIVGAFAQDLGGRQEATVWGQTFRVPAPNSALVNGTEKFKVLASKVLLENTVRAPAKINSHFHWSN